MDPEIREMVAGQMGGTPPVPPEIQALYDQYAQEAQAKGQEVIPIEQFVEMLMGAQGGMPPPQGGMPPPPQGGMPPV